jgi:RNA polymerase sigma factor (sigma-70 family)
VKDPEDIQLFSTIDEFRRQVAAFDPAKIKKWLWRYCRHRSGAVYEDLRQTVYAKLFEADLDQVYKIRDLDKFICGVCKHVGVDWQREVAKRSRLDDTVKQWPEPTPHQTPESTVIEKDQRRSVVQAVAQAIAQLPKRQREIYVLYHVEGRDMESIAQKTGCRVSTIKRTIHDAMTKVRKFVSKEESARTARSKT